jgi:hypothetical protein
LDVSRNPDGDCAGFGKIALEPREDLSERLETAWGVPDREAADGNRLSRSKISTRSKCFANAPAIANPPIPAPTTTARLPKRPLTFISSDCPAGGSVAVRERLPQFVANVRSPEAHVLKQVVVEFTQFLTRTDALAPQPNGGDDLPDRRQQLEIPLATTRHLSREPHIQQRPQWPFVLCGAIKWRRTGGPLCGVRHRDGRARTAKTRRADLLASSQHLLNESGRPALAAPPCSRHLIWETTPRSLSQNLLSFCSPLDRTSRGVVILSDLDPVELDDQSLGARGMPATMTACRFRHLRNEERGYRDDVASGEGAHQAGRGLCIR